MAQKFIKGQEATCGVLEKMAKLWPCHLLIFCQSLENFMITNPSINPVDQLIFVRLILLGNKYANTKIGAYGP